MQRNMCSDILKTTHYFIFYIHIYGLPNFPVDGTFNAV